MLPPQAFGISRAARRRCGWFYAASPSTCRAALVSRSWLPPRGHVHVRSVSVRSPLTTWHCEQVRVGRYHRSAAATVDPCQWPGSGAGRRTGPCLYPRWPAARAFGRCAAHPACSRTAGRRGGRHLCEGTADCQAAKR